MREILFRAKSNQTWYYGYVYPDYESPRRNIWRIATPNEDILMINPDTICEWSGLTDKNGVKIFEGDIVKHKWEFLSNGSYHHYEDFIVEFKDSAYYIVPIKKHENIWTVYLNPESEYEVIGNIYDYNI